MLRCDKDFVLGPEHVAAFEYLKSYLTKLTTLSCPTLGVELLLYLVALHSVVSATLIQEK